jgi:MoaA/NifB/PqqE/SkfB family radical SAM enzyme
MNPEDRITSWLQGEKKGPFSLELRPTERCNLSCLSCVKHADFYNREMSDNEITKEKYLELIEESSRLGVRKILISGGGEPFVREDISEILNEIKENGIEGEIITNGTLLNKYVAENLVNIGWDSIIISLDGPNKKINDFLRTKGFDNIIKNINYINYFKKRYKTKKPKITIATVLTNKNYDVINKMLKLCKKLHVDNFRLQELVMWSKKGEKLRMNEEQWNFFNSNLLKLIKYSDKLKIENNLNDFLPTKNKSKEFSCFAPFYDISIADDGSVRYCQMSPKSKENINDKKLEKIWFGKDIEKFRKKLLNKEFPDFCKNCCSPRIFDMKRINEKIKNIKVKEK